MRTGQLLGGLQQQLVLAADQDQPAGIPALRQVARELPATASAFSIMAVPLVGILAAAWIVGEIPRWQDWVAMVFVVGAIATTLLGRPADSAR